MEKGKPTYDLEALKECARTPDALAMTTSAMLGAAALGYGRDKIVETIQSLSRKHFYKSMTANANHRIWQDVYHAPSEAGLIYIKFTAGTITEFLLLSFKKK
ncbi:MAG: type II toxin-antitoxin system MqsR family toxin [Thermodesulfobacteriota bacterium]